MKNKKPWESETQQKNLAWFLPRPKPPYYKGSMPLYCEEWLLGLARDLLGKDDIKILNLFCGTNKQGFRVDINSEVNPDCICDAHKLADSVHQQFEVILADPPYSSQEAKDLYDTPPLKYKIWTAECDKLLSENGLLIVYHKFVMPNPNPEKYFVEKRVFIGNRPYHLPRVAIYFRKKQNGS
ncbi:hypothetical protein LCGC14_0579160 [marine sediment metagenome]|uniref:DNA methylase N-4/N-6 domain-containing protein n=1 Tax=marine sediment metagenome TaxID=412755 RepID=A0A0F9S0M8_9ZZZZ|nr:hypothetical protein [Pricia sp.]